MTVKHVHAHKLPAPSVCVPVRLAAIAFEEKWDEDDEWRQEGMNEKRDMVVQLRKRRRERAMHRRSLKDSIAKVLRLRGVQLCLRGVLESSFV